MTILSKILSFILAAAWSATVQEAPANDDVKVDDIFSNQNPHGIVHVIEHPADEVAAPLIQRALQGHVKKPNSTIVTDPHQPHKENYSVSFTFKESPHARRRPKYPDDTNLDFSGQPCGIGLVTLVSDDGCTISMTDDKGKNRNG